LRQGTLELVTSFPRSIDFPAKAQSRDVESGDIVDLPVFSFISREGSMKISEPESALIKKQDKNISEKPGKDEKSPTKRQSLLEKGMNLLVNANRKYKERNSSKNIGKRRK